MSRVAAALLVSSLFLPNPAMAGWDQGSAGPFRNYYSGIPCSNLDAPARIIECNPPAVADGVPAPKRAQARYARAIDLIGVLKYEEAADELTRAIADDPEDAKFYVLRGRMAIPTKIDLALQDLTRAIQIDPNNENALASLAYLEHQDRDLALSRVNKSLTINPQNADALWIRARIRFERRQIDEAEKDLTHAISLEPNVIRARIARATIRMGESRFAEAIDDLTEILKVRPDPTALKMRALSRARHNDHAGAIADITLIIGPQGEGYAPQPFVKHYLELYIQRAIAFAKLNKLFEATTDVQSISRQIGRQELLQLQVYLRRSGFPDVPLDGKNSDALKDALIACFVNDACGRGVSTRT